MATPAARRRLIAAPALAVLLAAPLLVLPATAKGGDPSGDSGDTPAGIAWAACPRDLGYGPRVQCAGIEVPLDWSEPDGRTVRVGINRLPASRPAQRVGSLVFNPGGPGGSGTQWVAAEAREGGLFGRAVRERYDIIGFDPRGVGTSRPLVRCDPKLWNTPVALFPQSPAAYERLEDKYAGFGESCERLTGPLLARMDTVSVARDLEVLRQQLGEGRLNFLGLSYGTQIGQEYARLYPQHLRRLALDGALVHSLEATTLNENESVAYDRSLEQFAAWCREAAACALRGEDPLAVFSALVEQADRTPIPAPACRLDGSCRPEVSGEDIRLNAQEFLLFRDGLPQLSVPGWKELGDALASARKGDASALSTRVITTAEDPAFSGLAVGCLDMRAGFRGYPALRTQMALGAVVAPYTRGAGQSYQYIAQCLRWPVPFSNPPRPADDIEPAVAPLIVNALYDPSTAYAWAQLMLTEFSNAVLLTREGAGHTSYVYPGAARDAVDRYLITGRTPPPGTFVR